MIQTEKNPKGWQAGGAEETIQTGSEDSKPKPKHQTAENSKLSFQEYRREGKAASITVKVCRAIRENGPLSRRQISQLTGIEIGALCKALHDMEFTADPIAFVTDGPCPITGRRVKFYNLFECIPGNQIPLPLK